jgi:hypothetical protein
MCPKTRHELCQFGPSHLWRLLPYLPHSPARRFALSLEVRAQVAREEMDNMRSLALLACATLLIGCAGPYENTIDPTTVDSMGASGAGAVALPGDGSSSFTNVPLDAVNPTTGAPTP